MPEPVALRRSACALVIVVAVAMACGRIVSAQRVYEPSLHRDAKDPADRRTVWPATRPKPMPTFSSNDRARWATIRNLVDEGTFVIGRRDKAKVLASAVAPLGNDDPLQAAVLASAGYVTRVGSDTGIIFDDGWQSVDKVMDPATLEFHSSKPPLLSVLIAGLYWLVQQLTEWTLTEQPAEVVRTILLLVNAVPFGIYLWQLGRLAESWGRTDWGRLFVVTAGAFATTVTPFLITLNNHTLATFAVMFAWLPLLRVLQHRAGLREGPPPWYHFVTAGTFAAFAACNEMPALAFAAAVFGLLLLSYPIRTLLLFVPPAALLTAAYFETNRAELGMWQPIQSEFGTELGKSYYEYEGSHWRLAPDQKKAGIDWARKNGEDRATYAVNVLVGHHGLFTLTPIWLLALAGMLLGLARLVWHTDDMEETLLPRHFPWFVQPLGLMLTVVVVGFYLVKSDNYGGWTNGLRWLMWLTPIWLTCLLPVADQLGKTRRGRWFGYTLLAVSVFSASYELWNPWRHPWLYDAMIETGWRGY